MDGWMDGHYNTSIMIKYIINGIGKSDTRHVSLLRYMGHIGNIVMGQHGKEREEGRNKIEIKK